jgi:hypothetical protein
MVENQPIPILSTAGSATADPAAAKRYRTKKLAAGCALVFVEHMARPGTHPQLLLNGFV